MDKEQVDSKVWDMYQLVVTYAPRFCAKMCYDLLDECQEYIFERVTREGMKRLKSFHGRSSESTFVYVVTSNLAKDFLKTKKKTVSYNEGDHVDLVHNNSLFDHLDFDDLNERLKQLKTEEQLILKLRYFDEYPVKEIADLFGKTPKQLSKKIENLKKKLKRMLT